MSTAFTRSDLHKLEGGSNLEVKSFVKGDDSPFTDLDYSEVCVYELTDYTFRTPLEKMDVFNQLLAIPHPCELWILPVTEEANTLLEDMPKDETYEKTAALFTMLSTFKEKIETDRTFLVAHKGVCEEVIGTLKNMGFTITEKSGDELQSVELA